MTDSTYQFPDGRPKATGATLHDSIVRVSVDDERARSDYTIHVEHPEYDRGVRCFWRNSREMVVSGIRGSLRSLDAEIARVEVDDRAGLGLGEQEILPAADRVGSTIAHAEVDA